MPLSFTPTGRFADTIGDGSGEKSAIGDYSLSPVEFKIKPALEEIYEVVSLTVYIEDSGSLDSGFYGNSIQLNNGIEIFARRGNVILWDITDGDPIKKNQDWLKYGFQETVSAFGQGTNVVQYRWQTEVDSSTMILEGANGDELVGILNDDFSGLTDHKFKIGYRKFRKVTV